MAEPMGTAAITEAGASVRATLPSAMGHGQTAGWHAHLERLAVVAGDATVPDDPRFETLLEV